MAESQRTCTFDGCKRPHWAKGLCSTHYRRQQRHGSPSVVLPTPTGDAFLWLKDHVAWLDDDCLAWPFARKETGYGVLTHQRRHQRAHVVMCGLAHGERPSSRHEAAHSCGKGHEGCVNPRHLRWDTRSGNFADKLEHGTDNRGEKNSAAKLLESEAREIRGLRGRETQEQTAERFGITRQTVSDIQLGRRWGWLEPSRS